MRSVFSYERQAGMFNVGVMSLSRFRHQLGMTMVEIMVALAIGSFLIIGAVQIYNQSRFAFVVNESIVRVQETAQFAMDTVESDLRMASNWGRSSRGIAIEGRTVAEDVNPLDLDVPLNCGEDYVLDLGTPVDGFNNDYALTCPARGGEQPDSDVVIIRRASVNPAPLPLSEGRLYIQSTRVGGMLFDDGIVPDFFSDIDSATHNLVVTSYYVAADSDLIPGTPTLRRKTLVMQGANMTVEDEEVAPGVENLQLQFGIDLDGDDAVDQYVNPNSEIYNPEAPGYIWGAKVLTVRVWMVVRSLTPEVGIEDNINYAPADVVLGVPTDQYRRVQVSKTVLLRNARG